MAYDHDDGSKSRLGIYGGEMITIVPDDTQWHTWFAWRPVYVYVEFFAGYIQTKRVFWEHVKRRRVYSVYDADWEYRLI